MATMFVPIRYDLKKHLDNYHLIGRRFKDMTRRFKNFSKKLKKEENTTFTETLERFYYVYRIKPNTAQKALLKRIYCRA